MAQTEFRELLAAARKASRWPEVPDFVNQVGISSGGYKKYENGSRIPSTEMLEQLIDRAHISDEAATKLRETRDAEKAAQMGLSLDAKKMVAQVFNADPEKLTERLVSEALYVLKQDGVKTTEKNKRVLKKRFSMILKNALEGL